MGLWNAADEAGKRLKEAHLVKKVQAEHTAAATEEVQKKQEQHQENKAQGMI